MLIGTTIVVTGAARGVGRAIAERCRALDATLILADILKAQGRETAAALGARFLPLDLATPASIEAFAADIGRQGRIRFVPAGGARPGR